MNDQNGRDETGAVPEHPNNENHNMAALLETEGIDIDFPHQGDIREGVIASITSSQILVSIGVKSEGVITGREFEQIPEEERNELKVGDKIPVYVINPEDQNGNLVLSFNRAQDEASWELAEKLMNDKDSYHGEITGYNKGGLIVLMGRLRGFVPASQISLTRRMNLSGDTPEQRWGKMVGEEIDVCVIEVDRERRRLILSERAASGETRETLKDMVIDNLEIGEVRTGRVTSLADFGAFVNINGADGLVHLSEISWERINSPADMLKVGQEVIVKVISIDKEKKRIGLSIRQLMEDPWASQVQRFQVGQLVEGTVTRLTKFGAFARLDDDFEGLIHISEISEKRIEHPKEFLHEGDVVTLRIIKIDAENHRIGLSMRKVESMAYADMDWQTLLTESMEESPQETAEEQAPVIVEEEKAELEAEIAETPESAGEQVEVISEQVKEVEAEAQPVKGEKEAAVASEVKPVVEGGAVKNQPVKKAEKKPKAAAEEKPEVKMAEAKASTEKSAEKKPKAAAVAKKVVEPAAGKEGTTVEEKKAAKPRSQKAKTAKKAEEPAKSAVGKATISEEPKVAKQTSSKSKSSIKEKAASEVSEKGSAVKEKPAKKETSTAKSAKTAAKEKAEEPEAKATKTAKASTKSKKSADKPEPASE